MPFDIAPKPSAISAWVLAPLVDVGSMAALANVEQGSPDGLHEGATLLTPCLHGSWCSNTRGPSRASFPRKRESTLIFAKSKMDSRFRGNDGEVSGAFTEYSGHHPPSPSIRGPGCSRRSSARQPPALFAKSKMDSCFRENDGEVSWAFCGVLRACPPSPSIRGPGCSRRSSARQPPALSHSSLLSTHSSPLTPLLPTHSIQLPLTPRSPSQTDRDLGEMLGGLQ
jgi:hypothetical protein